MNNDNFYTKYICDRIYNYDIIFLNILKNTLFVSANVEDFCFLDDDSICIRSSTLEEFSEMNNCDNERLSGEHIITFQ